jgi:hypothetical protein
MFIIPQLRPDQADFLWPYEAGLRGMAQVIHAAMDAIYLVTREAVSAARRRQGFHRVAG